MNLKREKSEYYLIPEVMNHPKIVSAFDIITLVPIENVIQHAEVKNPPVQFDQNGDTFAEKSPFSI